MRVESLTHHGLGRTEDGTLVPRVVPGEQIELQPDGSARILSPSSDRVSAPCRHFRRCGGCSVQHIRDEVVADWKRGIVRTALAAQGLPAPLRHHEVSPPGTRRRAKFSARRTKAGATVGFHARASDLIVEVPDCVVLTSALLSAGPLLQEITAIAASRRGEIGLTVTDSVAGIDIRVETDQPLTEAARLALAELGQKGGVARIAWGDELALTIAAPVQTFGDIAVVPPPGAFLQATRHGENALRRGVCEIVADSKRIIDLFAGCGTFALPLARQADVMAIEGSEEMIAAMDGAWRRSSGLRLLEAQRRDLFRRPLEPDELADFDAVVIDPPRAGAAAQIARLSTGGPARIAMVSCNPATFARDARTLIEAGYEMHWIDIVDQFRWSAHVELVSSFTRM